MPTSSTLGPPPLRRRRIAAAAPIHARQRARPRSSPAGRRSPPPDRTTGRPGSRNGPVTPDRHLGGADEVLAVRAFAARSAVERVSPHRGPGRDSPAVSSSAPAADVGGLHGRRARFGISCSRRSSGGYDLVDQLAAVLDLACGLRWIHDFFQPPRPTLQFDTRLQFVDVTRSRRYRTSRCFSSRIVRFRPSSDEAGPRATRSAATRGTAAPGRRDRLRAPSPWPTSIAVADAAARRSTVQPVDRSRSCRRIDSGVGDPPVGEQLADLVVARTARGLDPGPARAAHRRRSRRPDDSHLAQSRRATDRARSPQPTSFDDHRHLRAAARSRRRSSPTSPEKSPCPSGWIASCSGLRWKTRASASIMSDRGCWHSAIP